ncbi:uncharacterized protein UHO2_06786 [Ustilago hordei]|uniref:Uncharacterized protein n=1 Tax=Ustilago hordei TaxID=120017 RepID=I2FZ33_USTHO|nr:uncharacterized protein UHO2_06786 [Ustilago hordei]CCF52176.1 uncharacterized protein UHOR_08461 [Ustilago hordei]SYW83572.1 uncharacterized protein UHO2_06786 [Ustilago hordei]
MPPCICDSNAESSNLSDRLPPTAPCKQILIDTETPTCYNSNNDDNNEGDEMHYDIDTISNLNPKVLKGMLIGLTKHNKAKDTDAYKKPSHCSNFHQRLSHTHDALKEAPKLTTKNWYAWNPQFRGILSNWPAAMKHLDGIVAPGDKKHDHTLNSELCTILQSSAQLAGNDNLKKDLTKMEKIAESTLLNKVGKIYINKHWAKAESMGHALPEILKIKTLINQAKTGNAKIAQVNLASRQVQNKEVLPEEDPRRNIHNGSYLNPNTSIGQLITNPPVGL